MDKISKALKKLSEAERKAVQEILNLLKTNQTSTLNIKKLKGHHDIFRIRKGKIRIIYRVTSNSDVTLLVIERRSDNTYSQLS